MPNAGALRGAYASVGTLRAWVHSRAPRLVKRGTRRSISIAPGTCTQVTGMRDRVPPARGSMSSCARDGSPKGARPGIPARDPRGSASRAEAQRRRAATARSGAAGRAQFLHFGQNGCKEKRNHCPAVSSAPAFWFGANAGARAFGAERWCGTPRRRRCWRRWCWSAAGRAQEVRIFANGPIETALTLWGGSRNSRANRPERR
jgi:hypothetical protein